MKISTKDMLLVSLFTALMIVGAMIKIPVGTVPITLQVLFVILSGMILGSRLGALSQIIYMLLGLIGLPVFTGGSGPSYVLTPSFGFIIGFILAAYIIGKLMEKLKFSAFNIFIISIIGTVIIYLAGIPYMYIILNNIMHMKITFLKAIETGCLIFLPADIIKCIIASFIAYKTIPAIRHIKSNN